MSSSRSNSSKKPKGKNVLNKMLTERTSFDEEIAKSLQFIEDFDITDIDNITDKDAKEYMRHTDKIRSVQRQQRYLMKNMNKTKSNSRIKRRSLPKFTSPSAVAAPAVASAAPAVLPYNAAPAPAVAAPAPPISSYIGKREYEDEGNEYTTAERKIWEQKLKDSVLYKIDIPEDWVPSPIIKGTGVDNSSSYSLIKLDKDGECYKSLLKDYKSTCGPRMDGGKCTDIEIFKVQNYEKLYEFIRNREILINKIGEDNLNETILYHGTGQGIDICSTGLDMRYGRGGMYGNGIYFADRSEISIGFSSGLVTVNRVLLGKKYFSSTRRGYVHPPEGHNSVYAKRGRGHEFILYNNNYSYIEYIICDSSHARGRNSSTRQPLISNYGNGLTPSAMKKAAQNPRAGYPNSVSFNGQPYWNPHVASQQFLANTIKQNRQFKAFEKKLYHKKTKYDKKTGEWIFPTITGKVDFKIGGKDYEKEITTEGEDIADIIKFCKGCLHKGGNILTPSEIRMTRKVETQGMRLENRYPASPEIISAYKKSLQVKYKDIIKNEKLAYKNGIKIIEKAKAKARGSIYKSRNWNKNRLISEIERRKSAIKGLKNKPWLYYSGTYLRYQLVNILLIDDEIMESSKMVMKNCENVITRLQRRWRNRLIKKKMDMIASSTKKFDNDKTVS